MGGASAGATQRILKPQAVFTEVARPFRSSCSAGIALQSFSRTTVVQVLGVMSSYKTGFILRVHVN